MAERESLLEAAKAATQRHRLPGQSYHKKRREQEQEVARDLKRRRGVALSEGAIVPVVVSAASRPTVASMADVLGKVREDNKSLQQALREQDHQTALAVKTWTDTAGVRARDRFVSAVPSLARDAPHFTCKACVGTTSLYKWEYLAEGLAPRAVAAMKKEAPGSILSCQEHWRDQLHMVIRHDEDDMRLLGLNGEGETEKKG